MVRLATVHLQPKDGETPREKCEQFAPLIADAADKNVDLVVLPETLTYYRSKGTYADAAESIPGPSTDYFGKLAKQHDLYIVAGLIERDRHLIYNVAAVDRSRWEDRRQVSQSDSAAQRDRRRHHAGQIAIRSSRHASAKSA